MKAAALCTLLLLAGPAAAYPAREPTHIAISLRGVDFDNPADVSALYERLQLTSRAACASGHREVIRSWQADNKCAHEALSAAVRDVNQPALTRYANSSAVLLASVGR